MDLGTHRSGAVGLTAAAAVAKHFDGLLYLPRFTTGISQTAVAVFGPAGADDTRAVDNAPLDGLTACKVSSIGVLSPPESVTVIEPPGVDRSA